MRDFCGKNGCYAIEKDEDVEYLNVFLNSVKVYEEHDNQFVYVKADKREIPDVIFELIKEEDSDNLLTTGMDVQSFCADGVNEFVAALIGGKIMERDSLYKAVERLLNEDGATWGIEPDVAAEV